MKDPIDELIESLIKKLDWIESNMRMSPHSSPFAICDLKNINKRIHATEKAVKERVKG